MKPIIADFNELTAVRCPCGWARRAFGEVAGSPCSVHRVEIAKDAQAHYHKHQTETYYILECDGEAAIELDDQRIAVQPGMAIMIPPGVRHRAIGRMTILNIVVPPFNPDDEWFD